jgi:hypothetical protein
VLPVNSVAREYAIRSKAVEILRVKIKVRGSKEKVSLRCICLAATSPNSMGRPKIEFILATKQERCIKSVNSFSREGIVRSWSLHVMKSTAKLATCRYAANCRTQGIKREKIDGAFLRIMKLKPTKEPSIFASLLGSLPHFRMEGYSREHQE